MCQPEFYGQRPPIICCGPWLQNPDLPTLRNELPAIAAAKGLGCQIVLTKGVKLSHDILAISKETLDTPRALD